MRRRRHLNAPWQSGDSPDSSCWRVNVFGPVCPKASVKDSPAIHCLDRSECMLQSLWNGTLVSPGFRLVSPGAQVWGHVLRKETVHGEVAFHGLVGQQRLFVWLRVRGCDVYFDLQAIKIKSDSAALLLNSCFVACVLIPLHLSSMCPEKF